MCLFYPGFILLVRMYCHVSTGLGRLTIIINFIGYLSIFNKIIQIYLCVICKHIFICVFITFRNLIIPTVIILWHK